MPFVYVYRIMSASAGVYIVYIIEVPKSIFSINAENGNIRIICWNKSTALGSTRFVKIVTYYLS